MSLKSAGSKNKLPRAKKPQTQRSLNKDNFLSVIVPAYRAEKFIKQSLIRVKKALDQSDYDYEIICVIDGKVDQTFSIAKNVANKHGKIRTIGYKTNLGKGHAVRYGMAKAKGNIIAFIDADLDLNPKGLSMLLEHFNWYEADIIVGSKRHSASIVGYPWQRRILSFFYQALVRVLFGLKVRDTQVGMKLFKRKVLEKTLPRLLVKAYAFDIEILAVAHHLGFKKIHEAPIESKMSLRGSTIVTKGFIRTVFLMLWDTLAVFYRLKILGYYDDDNRKNWVNPKYLILNKNK